MLSVIIDDQPFVPSGDSADEEETIDMEEESAAKVSGFPSSLLLQCAFLLLRRGSKTSVVNWQPCRKRERCRSRIF